MTWRAVSEPGCAWQVADVEVMALRLRRRAVDMVAANGLGYLGQALSVAEQISALFAEMRPGVDRLVVSPGHYVIAVFAAAVELGLVPEEEAARYGQDGAVLEAIGTERSPVLDYTAGSLGQGLSAAAGFALADRMTGAARRTFAVVSDGEMEEGQTWEAALFAAHERLGRLVVTLDVNNSQVDGAVDCVTTLEPIVDKWAAFGWHVQDVDGHDHGAVRRALTAAIEDEKRPSVVVCRTSTTHGLDCLPDSIDGHFVTIGPDLARRARRELDDRLAAHDA